MLEAHRIKVEKLQRVLSWAHQNQSSIRLVRSSTNSTRASNLEGGTVSLDVRDLNQILEINFSNKYADVEPGVSMDVLVQATLSKNLIPPVVPEFPAITVGGAVQGGALESSSFKFGQFNDSILEYELLLADGRQVIATPFNEYEDLYWGISTSYGSLAIITRVRVPLIEAKQYVEIKIISCNSDISCTEVVSEEAKSNDVDFIEGLIFSKDCGIVVKGKLTDIQTGSLARFRRNIDPWYYRFLKSAKRNQPITIPLLDYLFRYDKGAFWMGEYMFPIFGLKSTSISRFLFAPFMRTRKLYDGLHALNIQHEYVIQDLYLSPSHVSKVLQFNAEKTHVYPLWLCPIKASGKPQKLASHYKENKGLLLNVGIYGKPSEGTAIDATKGIEKLLSNLGDRKMLYAQTFWSKEDFWKQYDRVWYETLRLKYGAGNLRDIWSKIYSGTEIPQPRVASGIMRLAAETLQGKNVEWR